MWRIYLDNLEKNGCANDQWVPVKNTSIPFLTKIAHTMKMPSNLELTTFLYMCLTFY